MGHQFYFLEWIQALIMEQKSLEKLVNLLASFFLFFGGYNFFLLFHELRKYRKLEDTPTCQIATGAMGSNVEVKGRAFRPPGNILIAPISGQTSAFYKLAIQCPTDQDNKWNSDWRTLDEYYSDPFFYIYDDSEALALVEIQDCEFRPKITSVKEIAGRHYWEDPYELPSFLEQVADGFKKFPLKEKSRFSKKLKIHKDLPWFSSSLRIAETSFAPDTPVYVFGYADTYSITKGVDKDISPKIKMVLRKKSSDCLIINNTEESLFVDQNRDKILSKMFSWAVITLAGLFIFVRFILKTYWPDG